MSTLSLLFVKILKTLNRKKRFRLKKYSSNQKWQSCLEEAFNYCLIGRWFHFSLKETINKSNQRDSNTIIANTIQIDQNETENFVSIYDYLKNQLDLDKKIQFLNNSVNLPLPENDYHASECNSIIDSTLIQDENQNNHEIEESILCLIVSQISIRNNNNNSPKASSNFSKLFL